MKRAGNLIEEVADLDNLKLAYVKACRAKPLTKDRLEFRDGLESRLIDLGEAMRSGAYQPGRYRFFTIQDPKERLISAAPFRDRVAQHAIMNVLDPIFERMQVHHSYACRRGKGTQAAVLAAFHNAKSRGWFLKLDVSKYFDSIDHALLVSQLGRRIKDRAVLALLAAIIESYQASPGRGLPIGNLTSQYFANHYLAGLDHFVLEKIRISRYIRYMDDMVLWSDDKEALGAALATTEDYLRRILCLEPKPPILNRSVSGLPFLGFLIKPSGVFLMAKARRRFRLSQDILLRSFLHGDLSEAGYADRALAAASHLTIARARNFRYTAYRRSFFGLEPGNSGR
jgi:RNA-directed DNA polymerase